MASSGVYPHRDHPHHGAPIYNARALGETLDRVKQEFEVLVGEVAASRDQRERYEATISSQADELEKIRGALHELEAQHNKVRAQYEYEVRVLRSEAAHPHPQPHRQNSLGQREQQQREQQQQRPGTASGSGSSSALPTLSSPSVFMGGGGPSSAHNVHSAAHSPVLDHHGHPREHSRDPMREGRDRDLREREREHSRDARELQRARFLEGGSGSNNKRIKLDQGGV
ncbi:Tup N-terminal-domain-containing protein [Mycena albidolilacea]|uniref:Tup N-terminal-domain-containing protein n=1 Tax=Mycena albidolilacea TaxID=1033008 RepID=A0AAD6ZET9_9AGAR|nr:Tup N-terminal-domain-containing protein [Mycena albidolilacea]